MENHMRSKRSVRLDFKVKRQNLSLLELFENIFYENKGDLFPITLIWVKCEIIIYLNKVYCIDNITDNFCINCN